MALQSTCRLQSAGAYIKVRESNAGDAWIKYRMLWAWAANTCTKQTYSLWTSQHLSLQHNPCRILDLQKIQFYKVRRVNGQYWTSGFSFFFFCMQTRFFLFPHNSWGFSANSISFSGHSCSPVATSTETGAITLIFAPLSSAWCFRRQGLAETKA